MNKLREKLAQAIAWPSQERKADAAILALREWLEAEGLVVVPREATEEMVGEACMAPQGRTPASTIHHQYRYMIAAAPDMLI